VAREDEGGDSITQRDLGEVVVTWSGIREGGGGTLSVTRLTICREGNMHWGRGAAGCISIHKRAG